MYDSPNQPMRRITFDIETEGEFRANGDFSNLEVTVVGVHDSTTNEYSTFLRHELSNLWPILERADMLVGYWINGEQVYIFIFGRGDQFSLALIPVKRVFE